MVRATRVANPLSRALGAGIGIGAMTAALFLMANTGLTKQAPVETISPVVAKSAPAP